MTNRTQYRNLIPEAARQAPAATADDANPGQGAQGQAGAGFSALVDAAYRNRKSIHQSGAQTPDAPAETNSAAGDGAEAWQELVARTYQRRHADRADREAAAAEERFIIATDRAQNAPR